MPEGHLHRSPRWLNARLRIARLTIAQWVAVALAGAIGILLYWTVGLLPAPHGLLLVLLVTRVLIAGAAAGVLAVVFYALADDRREPIVRQAVLYPFRRHSYRAVTREFHHAQLSPLSRPRRRSGLRLR
jgi:hypothetical protein